MTRRTNTLTINLKIAEDDDMAWAHHKIPGLRYLTLNSGPITVLGRNPKLLMTLLGVKIRSELITANIHEINLRSPKFIKDPAHDQIPEVRLKHDLYDDGLTEDASREYRVQVAEDLRYRLRNRIYSLLENKGIYGISQRDVDRWITISVGTNYNGYPAMFGTSRPIPLDLLRS